MGPSYELQFIKKKKTIQYGLQHPSRFIQMIQNVLNELQCGYLLQLGSLHGLLRNSCSTMVSFMDSKGFSASACGASSYSLTLVFTGLYFTFFFLNPHRLCTILLFLKCVLPEVTSA